MKGAIPTYKKAARVVELINSIQSLLHESVLDYSKIEDRIIWQGLSVARQAAVAARYGKKPSSTGVPALNHLYKELEGKGQK